MSDDPKSPDDHGERVKSAFDDLQERVRERLDEASTSSIDRLRAAAAERDAESLRSHLTEMKEEDSWLYRELAAHPRVAALIDELALWGF